MLFNIEVTLAVMPYSCFTHLVVLCCTISILLLSSYIVDTATGPILLVAYSSIGHTNVEYVVAFTLVWYHIGIKFL